MIVITIHPRYQPQFTSLIDQFTERLGESGVTQEQINTRSSWRCCSS
jgi:hypothetical protein